MNLNRTEELEIKKDIKGIKKALENSDPFFGKIHMSEKHIDAWIKEFDSDYVSLVGLMEECAELQQAASKYYRKYRDPDHPHCAAEKEALIEEMAHVLIDIRMLCNNLDISPEDIQQEIFKKYPDGYNIRIVAADGKMHYEGRGES